MIQLLSIHNYWLSNIDRNYWASFSKFWLKFKPENGLHTPKIEGQLQKTQFETSDHGTWYFGLYYIDLYRIRLGIIFRLGCLFDYKRHPKIKNILKG